MKTASPLRYPGGKTSLASLLTAIRQLNDLQSLPLGEPFAGGAGASLTLLFREEVPGIHINDADPALHDFWWSVISRNKQFLQRLESVRATIPEWRRQRRIYETKRSGRFNRGFAAFYLNRCNHSGIIMNGGPIGGIDQRGAYKINARFNKIDLIDRCSRISEFGDRINVTGLDGIDFIAQRRAEPTQLFIDPPYYVKGPTLYLNALDHSYHERLAEELRAIRDLPWILTYDDCKAIRSMYEGWAKVRPFTLRYVAAERRAGREVLIAPKWMTLPKQIISRTVNW